MNNMKEERKALEQQRDRIINWLEMLSVLPNESEPGRIRDSYFKGALESELWGIERKLQLARGEYLANELLTMTNGLRRLGYL